MGEEVKGCSNSVGASGCCVYVDICIHIFSDVIYLRSVTNICDAD